MATTLAIAGGAAYRPRKANRIGGDIGDGRSVGGATSLNQKPFCGRGLQTPITRTIPFDFAPPRVHHPYLHSSPYLLSCVRRSIVRRIRGLTPPGSVPSCRVNHLLGQRSISPITMSSEPTIAGMSAIRQPRPISLIGERLLKQLLRARARQGIAVPPRLTR